MEGGRKEERKGWRGEGTKDQREREKGGRQGTREAFIPFCNTSPPTPGYSCPNTLAHPQAWAIHKGKHLEGTDKEDPSTWKTRLRCALNKSVDFREVRERSQLDISNPYRVYQIVSDSAHGPGNILPLEVMAKDGSLGNKNLTLHIIKWEMVGLLSLNSWAGKQRRTLRPTS